MGKQSEIKHLFGGCATILLLVIILAVFVFKLTEVFSRKTMTATSFDAYNSNIQTNFNTQMYNTTYKPQMIMFDISPGNLTVNLKHSKATSNIKL
jgi:hypothetical protein